MLIGLGITTLISKMITSHQEMLETLNSTAQSFDKENQSIEENKAKIIELKTALDSGNLSYSDATYKRDELLSIQSSLIESYGSEADGIDLVNGSLETQLDLLDKINNKKLQEAVNKANEYTTGQKIANVGENFSQYLRNFFDGNFSKEAWTWDDNALGTNLNNAMTEMEGFSAKFKSLDNENLNKIIESFKEISRLGDTFYIRGNAEDVKNTVMELQEQLGSSTEYTDELNSQLTDIYNRADNILSDYKEGYNLAKMQEIAKDETLSNYYNDITDSYNDYKNAMTSGDEEIISQTLQNYSELLQSMSNDKSVSNSMFRYFTEMYPELKSEIESWKFDTKITPELDVEDSNINSDIKQLSTFTIEDLSRKYTDIINGTSGGLTDIQQNALINIKGLADECDMTLDEFLAKLNEAGKLQSKLQSQVKQNELEPQTIDLSNVTSQVTSFTSSYESLNTAISEQNQNGTISSETLKELYDNYESIDSVLETTTNGIRINTQEFAKLNAERKNAIKSELTQKEEELTAIYNNGSMQLAMYEETLANCTNTKSEDYEILSNLIEKKKADQEATLGQIGELENLSLEYENAISKHNAFIKALSSEDAGNGYDAITSGLKKVEEEWSKGNYGKDEIRTFVDYMSYTDMSTASITEIKNAYEEAMSTAKKYFTETVDGQQNFLNLLKDTKVNQEALASVDEDGNWTINISDMDEAAKACGFSVDFLSDNLKKLEEKGFEGAFSDRNGLVDTSAQLKELDNQIAILETRLNSGDKTNGLQEQLDKLRDERTKISVELDQSKVKKAIDDILSIQEQINNLSNTGASSSEISNLQQQQKSIADKNGIDLNSVLNVDTNDAESKWKVFEETIENSDLKTKVTVNANTNPFDTAIRTITNGKYTADIGLKITTSGIVGKVKEVFKNAVSKATSTGDAGAYGSVNIKGSSYADGNIGIQKDQKNVMVAEIKPEMVVNPHSGEYTIYKTPTMLAKLPKDAIVFNGKQTEEILKNGMTTSFGKAYAKGYNSSGTLSGSNSNSSSKSSKKKKEKEKSKTLIDWIERRINVLTQKAERWSKIIENATNPNRLDSYYKKLEENYKKQLKTYSNGATRYLQKANSIKLGSDLKNKVKSKDSSIFNKNGSMKSYKSLIKEYGEKTAKKIQDYQNYIDKYESALDSFIETSQKLYQAPIEKAANKIELLTKSLDLLDAKLDNFSVDDYKKANANLDEQSKNAEKQLKANQEAEQTAKSNYNSTKSAVTKKSNLEANDLTGKKNNREKSKKLIKDAIHKGEEIDLTLYKVGSSGYKAAIKYNAALKAQKDATDAVALSQEEYTKTVRENAKSQFDNVKAYYESQVKLLDNQFTSYDNKISEMETAGAKVNKLYYTEQKSINEDKKKQYEEEKARLEEQIASIPQGTEEWYDAKDAIQECDNKISDCVKSTYELNNAINQLHFDIFDDTSESIDRVITEQEFLQGLFDHEKLTDDKTGSFTDAGFAKLGSLSASYYASKKKTENDAAEVKELQRMLDSNSLHSDTLGITFNSVDDLEKKLKETYTQWQDDIKETYSLESNIADMMKEKYQVELDLLQELIDNKKDALNAEKDLHDYQMSIQQKTKDINTIRNQINAYSGDTSQEANAKLQKLQVQLSEKERELEEAEYDRYISDQEDMLDKLYTEYEELITKKLEDFMTLVREGLETANQKTADISEYISKVATANGYKIETNGLFDTVNGSISESTTKIVDAIINHIKGDTSSVSNSGNTESNAPLSNTGYQPLPSIELEKSQLSSLDTEKVDTEKAFSKSAAALKSSESMSKNDAVNFIKKYGTPPDPKEKNYGKVNKALQKKYSKVLSTANMKELAKTLGITYDSDKIYSKLKSLKVPGFKKGGIVSIDNIEDQVYKNGDKVLISANPGEGVLTPIQTEMLQKLADVSPQLNATMDMISNITKIPDIQPIGNSTSNIDATYNFILENCTNADDIIHQIQQNQKIQKVLRAVTIDRAFGGGNLRVNKIK